MHAALGSDASRTAADVAQLFVALQQDVGGDFFVVEADDRRAVIGNRRCPFGSVVEQAPSLCRVTSALVGMPPGDAEHGRAVALMHALMDRMSFPSEPETGTIVHLVKQLTFGDGALALRLMSPRND